MKNPNPLPSTHGDHGLPRRCQLQAFHKAEAAIWQAMQEVEQMGADPLLTDAITKLSQAKDHVADWLEGKTGA